jgi:hypothetical protein
LTEKGLLYVAIYAHLIETLDALNRVGARPVWRAWSARASFVAPPSGPPGATRVKSVPDIDQRIGMTEKKDQEILQVFGTTKVFHFFCFDSYYFHQVFLVSTISKFEQNKTYKKVRSEKTFLKSLNLKLER